MNISKNGLDLVKAFEGCLAPVTGGFKAYVCPAGKLTIGYGHTNDHGRSFNAGSVWTQAECDAELATDMEHFETVVKRLITVPLEQFQFDALVSFSYNCGEGALQGSTLRRKINAKDFDDAALEFGKWVKGKDAKTGEMVTYKGLVRRRGSESLLFRGLEDRDFDGKADGPSIVTTAAEPMPQQVEPPVVKPSSESTIQTGAKVGGGLSLATIGAYVMEKLSELPKSVLDFITTLAQKPFFWLALAGGGAFLYIDWRRKVMRREEGV